MSGRGGKTAGLAVGRLERKFASWDASWEIGGIKRRGRVGHQVRLVDLSQTAPPRMRHD